MGFSRQEMSRDGFAVALNSLGSLKKRRKLTQNCSNRCSGLQLFVNCIVQNGTATYVATEALIQTLTQNTRRRARRLKLLINKEMKQYFQTEKKCPVTFVRGNGRGR
ncbi:UNVERIFIED_CONTAM: hypothetical protein K2H54_042696 [Gekko kuhli]